ncbi:MAG: paraquat-inducible protein A [Pseudomonadota bacterium]
MSAESHACHVCDWLFELPALADGEAAYCPRCGHHITTRRARFVDVSLSLALAGLVLLLTATAYPFLGFAASGQIASMTLLDSALALLKYQQPALGAVVFVLIFAGPICLLGALIVLLYALRRRLPLVALPAFARIVHWLTAWNMVEVFLIGTLVSLVKISSLATIHLGYAFWAFVGFTLCTVAAVASLDRVQLWREIDAVLGR